MSLSLTSFLEVMPPLLKAAVVTVEISILSLAFACVIAPPPCACMVWCRP